MGEFSTQIIAIASSVLHPRAAPEQSGVFVGLNPATFNSNDPFVLWVIQSIVIIAMTQFLHMFLSRIRQPRVIAEVIAGVLLGPTVLGRAPGFTNAIFPRDSIPMLTLTSTIGLVFFLFLVGMELDTRVIKRNAKASAAISIAGLVIPLGLGAALAIPLYHQFIDSSVNYGYFILFVSVAVGITAFPVLCRILTEVKLLDTTVGVLVLSAGVGNDVIGWVLLALAVALVNATSGLTALYVLLTGFGFVLFLIFPVKWMYVCVARRFGGLDRGEPTSMMMTLTFVIVLFSAFFTDIIGIHPIFGGFLAGLIIPKENGFEISLVEKLEDFIGLLLLPQYFVISGLRTDLGLLDNGITWGYTFLICVVAFSAKFLSCSATAKAFGFNLRESGAVGSLMACKGLVELIVLNVGLQANILNTRVFSMFVLHALVLTFITTPLTMWFYPPRLRIHAGNILEAGQPTGLQKLEKDGAHDDEFRTKFAIVLDKFEQLPSAMILTQLLERKGTPSTSFSSDRSSMTKASIEDLESTPETSTHLSRRANISVDALRLIELTERTSAVLKSQSADVLIRQDPILSVLRTFGQLRQVPVSVSLSVVSQDEFSSNVADHVRQCGSQMLIVPWSVTPADVPDTSMDPSSPLTPANPFEALFRKSSGAPEPLSSAASSQLVRRIFSSSPTDIVLFVDRGLPQNTDVNPHIFLPFFGGPDDRLALSFVIQLCAKDGITATVVRFRKTEVDALEAVDSIDETKEHFASVANTIMFPDTVYGSHDSQTRRESDVADNFAWGHFTLPSTTRSPAVSSSLSRIVFEEEFTSRPLHRVLEKAGHIATRRAQLRKPLFIVAGRSRRMAMETHRGELLKIAEEHSATLSSESPKTFGEVAASFMVTGTIASLVVVQASRS
ncbi:cation/H+ exchanger [Amylostereum chailletii]|nr:cation/H+ exchanger [Amylostereum chailletii]